MKSLFAFIVVKQAFTTYICFVLKEYFANKLSAKLTSLVRFVSWDKSISWVAYKLSDKYDITQCLINRLTRERKKMRKMLERLSPGRGRGWWPKRRLTDGFPP